MKLRKRFLPKELVDVFSFVFVVVMVPFGYCFAVFYVLPTMYPPSSPWFVIHCFLGSFVLVNIAGNFVFVMIADTSVSRLEPPPSSGSPRWNFCRVCQLHIPPRAWHCSACDCCILKRDHHCQFTGCCVGHRNHRYFFFFVLYMAIGTTYAVYFHSVFMYRCAVRYISVYRDYNKSPLLALMRSCSYSMQHCYVVFYGVTFFGMGASMFFFIYHLTTIARGLVMYERSRCIYDYDSGSVRKNLVQVLGHRWYLAWISPLVSSELPGDGVKWVKCKPDKRII